MRNKVTRGAILFIMLFSTLMVAQEKKETKKKWPQLERRQKLDRQDQLVIPRVRGSVTLDGLSNELAWEGIKTLPVVMHSPNFGNAPSELTEILVAFDNDFLYVAGRLYDSEPSRIQVNSKQRDSGDPSSEWFGIVIDSFNDKENALAFFTTPAGLRWDAAFYNDAQEAFSREPLNTSWNSFWDVSTESNDEGWFVEMRIPFSSLRFQDQEGRVVMGIISWRKIARKNEWVIFPAIPPDWGFWSKFKPSQAQEVLFEGLYSQKLLYVAPYLLGGHGQSSEKDESESFYRGTQTLEHEAGLDIKYGLTSNLTFDVTLNTDFAQVEADDQQINLTRFSLFFPEKRLFFQERSSNFDFSFGGPNRLFYSRRIGLYEGEPVRIYGGIRLVGRAGPWDLGFLSMQTAPIQNLPSENFGIFRMRRQVFNPYSYLGGILTTRLGIDGSHNIAYGLDGIIRVSGDDYVTLKWAQTFETDQNNNPLSLDSGRIYVSWDRRTLKGFSYNLLGSYSGPTYNPGIGFKLRDNFACSYNVIGFGWLPGENSSLFFHRVFSESLLILSNTNGKPESAFVGLGYEFETKSGYEGRLIPGLSYENVPDAFSLSDDAEVPEGEYSYFNLTGEFSTPGGNPLNTQANFDTGSFYDGWRVSICMNPRWNISSSIELEGSYQFNHVAFPRREQQFTSHITRLRVLYMLNTKLSATAFLQYNSAIDTVIFNFRLRYNPREGIDFYLVYNESLNTNRYRETPFLPFSNSRAILLKYTYTFNS